MLYPVYVHKDEGSAYGLTFPDFPGCFSAADELADLPRMAQEAVEVYFEGETFATPVPSTPEQWAGDERFQGGYWMLVEHRSGENLQCAGAPQYLLAGVSGAPDR